MRLECGWRRGNPAFSAPAALCSTNLSGSQLMHSSSPRLYKTCASLTSSPCSLSISIFNFSCNKLSVNARPLHISLPLDYPHFKLHSDLMAFVFSQNCKQRVFSFKHQSFLES